MTVACQSVDDEVGQDRGSSAASLSVDNLLAHGYNLPPFDWLEETRLRQQILCLS
tara:strand:- start:352 stop:516 length:165 start_codon:yes stop_codon:yes gene_type:complete